MTKKFNIQAERAVEATKAATQADEEFMKQINVRSLKLSSDEEGR